MHAFVRACVSLRVCWGLHVCSVCACVCVFVVVSLHMCLHVCVFVCLHVCVCVLHPALGSA